MMLKIDCLHSREARTQLPSRWRKASRPSEQIRSSTTWFVTLNRSSLLQGDASICHSKGMTVRSQELAKLQTLRSRNLPADDADMSLTFFRQEVSQRFCKHLGGYSIAALGRTL